MSIHKSIRDKVKHVHYILDGYNIIYALPSLEAKLGRKRGEESREDLFHLAAEIAQATASKATLFFDGPDAEDLMESGCVHVIYSGSRKADACICEKAAKLFKDACVVTGDNAILSFCKERNIATLSPLQWIRLLPSHSEKPDYPSHTELHFWERVFNKKLNGGGSP